MRHGNDKDVCSFTTAEASELCCWNDHKWTQSLAVAKMNVDTCFFWVTYIIVCNILQTQRSAIDGYKENGTQYFALWQKSNCVIKPVSGFNLTPKQQQDFCQRRGTNAFITHCLFLVQQLSQYCSVAPAQDRAVPVGFDSGTLPFSFSLSAQQSSTLMAHNLICCWIREGRTFSFYLPSSFHPVLPFAADYLVIGMFMCPDMALRPILW